MSEICKLYENAEVKKQIPKVCSSNELYCKECEAHIEDAMPYCKNAEYPHFTAEKQIKLIEWCLDNYRGYIFDSIETKWFEEQLSAFINNIWQDLTEEERKQIKEILE